MQQSNQRRVLVLIVMIFIAVISFFAGRHFGRTSYIQPSGVSHQPGSERAGIPPDSLQQ